MTEAEAKLVNHVLACDEISRDLLQDFREAIAAERVSPEKKRAWIDAWKEYHLAKERCILKQRALGLPEFINFSSWREEARLEVEGE